MKKMLVILGPTATSKTDIALAVAKKFNGELVACDSRQVYKGLDIGTGKTPSGNFQVRRSNFQKMEKYWEIGGIRVWMYDVVDPRIQYSVYDYIRDAKLVIKDIFTREKLPIIVGGTGLYLKGLLEGFNQINIPVDPSVRQELQNLPLSELQNKLKTLSPIVWNKMNPSDQDNPRRLIRKIEQIIMYPYISKNKSSSGLEFNHDILKIGLTAPRPQLYLRIDLRLDLRIRQGLIAEGQDLLKSGVSVERMRQLGLEYGCLADFLEGKISEVEFTQKLKNKIHQYAKRQETWFKKEKGVVWFDITEPGISHRVESEVRNWYNNGNYAI